MSALRNLLINRRLLAARITTALYLARCEAHRRGIEIADVILGWGCSMSLK